MTQKNKMYNEKNTNKLSLMLEENPREFLKYIKQNPKLTLEWTRGNLNAWFERDHPPLHQLIRLTGKLVEPVFWFSKLPDGIPEDLALEIFEELKKHNLNPKDTDYYNENLEQFLRNREHKADDTNRTGNERLIRRVCEYYGLPDLSDITKPKEYHAPPSCSDPYPYPPEGPPRDPYADGSDSESPYHYPVPAPTPRITNIRPPTYDGHFQNFMDNMDEYEHTLEQQELEEEQQQVADFLGEIEDKGDEVETRFQKTQGEQPVNKTTVPIWNLGGGVENRPHYKFQGGTRDQLFKLATELAEKLNQRGCRCSVLAPNTYAAEVNGAWNYLVYVAFDTEDGKAIGGIYMIRYDSYYEETHFGPLNKMSRSDAFLNGFPEVMEKIGESIREIKPEAKPTQSFYTYNIPGKP